MKRWIKIGREVWWEIKMSIEKKGEEKENEKIVKIGRRGIGGVLRNN